MDYSAGVKKEVAEVKFLIHDLRVESFFNDVIHYHVTVSTDLEIHSADQAQVLHETDLSELKAKVRDVRRSHQEYSAAVKNFSPDKTVLLAGKAYLQAVWDLCELILNPLWGRTDQVLSFLPPESRSVRSRSHSRNCLRWICGVYYRLEHFRAEQEGRDVCEQFDVADDLELLHQRVRGSEGSFKNLSVAFFWDLEYDSWDLTPFMPTAIKIRGREDEP